MTPKLAFDLESRQIEKLDVAPMVSITDHDNIKAPMLLRTVPSARQIPVSVEWSAPYGGVQDFHLGIHNLPSARAPNGWLRSRNSPRIPTMTGSPRFWRRSMTSPTCWWSSTIRCGTFSWSGREKHAVPGERVSAEEWRGSFTRWN